MEFILAAPEFDLPMKRTLFALAVATVLALAIAVLAGEAPKIETTTPEALHQRLAAAGSRPLVVDVREPEEFAAGHIDGALLAPLSTVEDALAKVGRNSEIVLVCRSGRRSGKAYEKLAEHGYSNLRNMAGGMLRWQELGYPVVTK